MFKTKNDKGFTLLELLVVLGIIGLLASIIVVNLTSARKRARDTKRVADLRSIQTALEDYYGKNGSYPTKIGDLVPTQIPIRPIDPLAPSGTTCTAAADVNGDDCYFIAYYPSTSPHYSYHLGASLEESGSVLLNQARKCNSTSGVGCPVSAIYTNGFAAGVTAGCNGSTANRYCYDVAQ